MSWVYDAAWMMGLRCYARLRGVKVQSDHSDTNEPRGNNGNGDVLLRLEELNASQLQTALVIANSPTNCRRVAARKRNQSIKYNQLNDVPDDDATIQLESALAIVNSPSNFVLTPRVAARKRKQSTKYDEFNNFSDDDDESKSTEIQDDHDMDWSNNGQHNDEEKDHMPSPCPTDDDLTSGQRSLNWTDNPYILPSADEYKLFLSRFIGHNIPDVFWRIIELYLWNSNIVPSTRIFIMKGSKNRQLNQLQCIDLSEKKPFNIRVHNISQDLSIKARLARQFNMAPFGWNVMHYGLCYVPNINCSSLLSIETQNTLNIDRTCQYNAIFKCCGRVRGIKFGPKYNFCGASMILCKEGAIDAHEIKLPPIPQPRDALFAQTTYSHKHGLITIYGKKVFVLNIENYCWEPIDGSAFLKHTSQFAGPICTLIDNGFGDELFICSQSGVECYNFSTKQWKVLQNMDNCSVDVCHSGIHYDGMNRVFVGGGVDTKRSVSYYNVCTDEWKNLPDTNRDHKNQCTIWSANNIVYIANTNNNDKDLGVVECIDLREKEPKWMEAPREMQLYSYVDDTSTSVADDYNQVQINGMFC